MGAKPVKLLDQKKTGLFQEHQGVRPLVYDVRATVPAIEALRAAGAFIESRPMTTLAPYRITLGDVMPAGIVAVHLPGVLGLRLAIEPEFPGEEAGYWAQVDFTPCPVCGASVVWYEAGYVPGYRVCTKPPHHHSLAK